MPSSPLSQRKFVLAYTLGWLILLADQAAVLYYFGTPGEVAIVDSIVSNIPLILSSLLILLILHYYLPKDTQFINIFFLCIFLAFIVALLQKVSLSFILAYYKENEILLTQSLPIRFSVALLLLSCVSLIGIIWHKNKERKEDENRKADAEKLAKEAELFKLRQQLQPHFLFNSLNSINALIGIQPQKAREMTQQLSDFLRGTLKKDEKKWVSLLEELQYLQLYLDIEKVRFGNRLKTEIIIDEKSEAAQVPALILQPVMENAIKFGLYDTTGEALIRLQTSTAEQVLTIAVSNPFDPETTSPKTGAGFGLKSIQRRLYLLFGRTDLLSTQTHEQTFTTTVKIPQTNYEQNNNN